MTATTEIKARPTIYKGIQMRSRLEADYAPHLDTPAPGWIHEPGQVFEPDWDYEPECFAGPGEAEAWRLES
jgi:hypothetical protein